MNQYGCSFRVSEKFRRVTKNAMDAGILFYIIASPSLLICIQTDQYFADFRAYIGKFPS